MRKTSVVMTAALAIGLCGLANAGPVPHMRGNTSITFADGSELHLGSTFRADVNVDANGATTTFNEAIVEVEFSIPPPDPGVPPGPCASIPNPGTLPPGPCRFFIRGETTTSAPQASLLIATLLLAHGYTTSDQIASTLGYTVTLTKLGGNSPAIKLPSDNAVFGVLFAELSAVDPEGAAAVGKLFDVAGIHLIPPGPCVPPIANTP